MIDDLDMLRDALIELREEIDKASRALAEYVKEHGDDTLAYRMADRILVAMANERRYRRLLVAEVAG